MSKMLEPCRLFQNVSLHMPLTEAQFTQSITVLFDEHADSSDPQRIAESATAFQNLAMHYIERNANWLIHDVVFDPIRLGLMLKRFYRDAFGVGLFCNYLTKEVKDGGLTEATKDAILNRLAELSVRINSNSPRKTRIAAAFSLWMATLRPICIKKTPRITDTRAWRLEATINFWIATRFLSQFVK